jgi:diguanylate cyclase (GGDEF)-like protein
VASSELRLSRRALDAYSRVLRSTLDAIDQAVLLIDERGEVLLCNQSFAQLAGLGAGYHFELRDLRAALLALGASADDNQLQDLLEASGGPTTLELKGERTVLCTVVPMTLDEGGDGRLIELRDVTLERRELRELEHRALHDDLSGLPNRDLLMDRLERALSRQGREGGAVGVVFLDLDGFKEVNDLHGHAAGDRILVEVSSRLQHELRDADTVGRLGGDEFVVICDGLENEAALARICERIQDRVMRPYQLGSAPVLLTASLGAVLEWNAGVPPAQVIERADALMYAAKRRSSRREIFVDGRPRATPQRLREVDRPQGGRWLREALDADQLYLVFLPIVAVDDQHTVAVEGLLRCRHSELVGLAPTQLMELVEQARLLERFDEWVLGEAARAARQLLEATGGTVRVTLNLSGEQLTHNSVALATAKAIAEYDIDAGMVGFDIAEGLVMANPSWLAPSLAALRSLGCWLLVDDVTTLDVRPEQLRDLGFTGVKLDRPVIGRTADDPGFAATARAGVTRARAEGLSVIGEGVDDERRFQAVQEIGCDSAQGFGFHGFPRTVTELLKVIDGVPSA